MYIAYRFVLFPCFLVNSSFIGFIPFCYADTLLMQYYGVLFCRPPPKVKKWSLKMCVKLMYR